MTKQVLKYTYEQFESDIHLLASKVKDEGYDLIIGLTRGGLWPAVRMSHLLNIPMVAINYSMTDPHRHDHFNGVASSVEDFWTKKILVVEDIADTGNTLQDLYSTHFQSIDVKTAVLIFKPQTCRFRPKYVATIQMTDHFIQFPWES